MGTKKRSVHYANALKRECDRLLAADKKLAAKQDSIQEERDAIAKAFNEIVVQLPDDVDMSDDENKAA